MKISAQKLFSFLEIQYDSTNFNQLVERVASTLTNIGFEIEDISFERKLYENFVIANVTECTKHPESSKLSICSVNNGRETVKVVCGAPNVCKGLKVILAQKGAVIPKNGMVIQKTKLAGIESNGMICSADELNIGANDGTILELPSSAEIGTEYADYVNKTDAILDISITPNRGDALSYYGIARELVAQGFGVMPVLETVNNVQTKTLKIDIKDETLSQSIFFTKFLCSNPIEDFSPILKKTNIGLTNFPIINCLNYITELYGQPMHLYDSSKIEGSITIRLSIDGEKLITISGQEITLKGGDIVIADDVKILSLAGIMGDARSSVSKETKEFVLEVCTFNRDLIFQSIRKYDIHTNASFRFERYVDSGNVKYFPQKLIAYNFLNLIKSSPNATFELQSKETPTTIISSIGKISKILGIELALNDVVSILQKLGFICTGDEGNLKITVPSHRIFDVKNTNDIAEEVIRSIDISKCPRKTLSVEAPHDVFNIHKIKKFLARNLHEVITYPFISQKDHITFSDISIEDAITLANPINESTPILRSSMVPSFLHHIAKMESESKQSTRIFEIAKSFKKEKENLEICIARSGFSANNNPICVQKEYNIFDIKEDVLLFIENIFDLKRESIVYSQITKKGAHPHQAFELIVGRNVIATIFQVHPLILEDYKITNKVFIATIHLQNIPSKQQKTSLKNGYKPFILPNIKRELSIVVEEKTTCLEILRCLQKITKNRFTGTVTEIYRNEALVKQNKKSLLLSLEIFQNEKTLISTEIDSLINEIIQTLEESVRAIIRTNKGDA